MKNLLVGAVLCSSFLSMQSADKSLSLRTFFTVENYNNLCNQLNDEQKALFNTFIAYPSTFNCKPMPPKTRALYTHLQGVVGG